MHVSEHHKVRTATLTDAIEGEGQILIPPIHRRFFPVAAAGAIGVRTQTGRTTVGHHDEGLIRWNLRCCSNDPVDRRLQIHRSINSLDGFRQMKTTACTTGPGTHNRHWEMVPSQARPAAMMLSKQGELMPQQPP